MSLLTQIDRYAKYRELSNRLVTAAKEHTCDDCGCKIEEGTKYYRIAFLAGGVFDCIKRHEYCQDELDWF